MSRSKNIGTRAESIVVAVARRNGFPYARRNVLAGCNDQGDVHLGDGTNTVIEVKGGKQCATLTPAKMQKWMKETRDEIRNSNSDYGFLVTQRAGYGEVKAEGWFAHIPAELVGGEHGDADYITTDLGTALRAVRERLDAQV